MKSIRFNRHSTAGNDGWVWDCYITPTGKVEGEVHNKSLGIHEVYNSNSTTCKFAQLWEDLNLLTTSGEADSSIQLVISTINDGEKKFYFLKSENEYLYGSIEKRIWSQINSIFRGTKFCPEGN